MPQFNAYPALQARTFDLQDIQRRGLQNRLLESKLQQAQGEAQRQAQMAPLMAQAAEGDQGALTQILAQNPGVAQKIIAARSAMSENERGREDRQREEIMRSVAYIDGLPELRRPTAWQQERQQLQQRGIDVSRVPETYDPAVLARAKADSQALDKLFAQADPPSGYRGTERGLEFIPGGPADPVQTQKLRAASGDTALQKDVPYIAKLAGVSEEEALTMKLESKSKSYKSYVSDIAARYASFGNSPERAHEKAVALGNLVYGRKQPESKDPDTAKGRSWWERVFGGGEPTGQGIDPPRLPNGAIDKSALKEGLVYRHPVNGLKYRWMGKTFEGPLP